MYVTGAIIQSEIRPMAVVIGFFYGAEKCKGNSEENS